MTRAKPRPAHSFHFTTPTQLAEVIVRMEQAGEGYRLPLIRAAATGRLEVVLAIHGQPVPACHLKQTMPTIVILADDHPASTGPAPWRQVRRLLRWAQVVVLHATGGAKEHFEMLTETTELTGRVLLIEMQYCHHAAWLTLVQPYMPRLKVLSIVPPPGDHHPRRPAEAVVQ